MSSGERGAAGRAAGGLRSPAACSTAGPAVRRHVQRLSRPGRGVPCPQGSAAPSAGWEAEAEPAQCVPTSRTVAERCPQPPGA